MVSASPQSGHGSANIGDISAGIRKIWRYGRCKRYDDGQQVGRPKSVAWVGPGRIFGSISRRFWNQKLDEIKDGTPPRWPLQQLADQNADARHEAGHEALWGFMKSGVIENLPDCSGGYLRTGPEFAATEKRSKKTSPN